VYSNNVFVIAFGFPDLDNNTAYMLYVKLVANNQKRYINEENNESEEIN